MSIVVKDSSTFTPAPEGQHQVVCVDVVEQYGVETQWGNKNMVRLVFQTRDLMPDTGKPYLISTRMTATLNEKGRLRPFLESWRGKKFSADELRGFDVEKLLGANAVVQIVHNESGGKVFANIQAVMRVPNGTPLLAARDYTRAKDRDDYEAPAAKGVPAGRDPSFDHFPDALEAEDDDLPF